MDRIFEPAWAALTVAVVSALALLGAYIFQYVGGLAPCEMCLWQRPPYYIAAASGLVAFVLAKRAPQLGHIILILLAIAGVALAVNAGLGIFHAGVEWDLWKGPASCGLLMPTSAEDILAQMDAPPPVPCDEAAWRLFGLSLAGYSALISAVLATICVVSVFRSHRGVLAI